MPRQFALVPFRLGAVELTVLMLNSAHLSPGALAALAAQVDDGTIRLADIVIVSKAADGAWSTREVDPLEFELAGLDIVALGLIGHDDLAVLVDRIPTGRFAAVLALEQSWATAHAERLTSAGAVVLGTERIPAPVVNAILDLIQTK